MCTQARAVPPQLRDSTACQWHAGAAAVRALLPRLCCCPSTARRIRLARQLGQSDGVAVRDGFRAGAHRRQLFVGWPARAPPPNPQLQHPVRPGRSHPDHSLVGVPTQGDPAAREWQRDVAHRPRRPYPLQPSWDPRRCARQSDGRPPRSCRCDAAAGPPHCSFASPTHLFIQN